MRKVDPEYSSRGVASMSEAVVEVICNALDCIYNDKSRWNSFGDGLCFLSSIKIRKGICVCYKMDKKWLNYTLRRKFNPKVIFPKEFKNKEWNEG